MFNHAKLKDHAVKGMIFIVPVIYKRGNVHQW